MQTQSRPTTQINRQNTGQSQSGGSSTTTKILPGQTISLVGNNVSVNINPQKLATNFFHFFVFHSVTRRCLCYEELSHPFDPVISNSGSGLYGQGSSSSSTNPGLAAISVNSGSGLKRRPRRGDNGSCGNNDSKNNLKNGMSIDTDNLETKPNITTRSPVKIDEKAALLAERLNLVLGVLVTLKSFSQQVSKSAYSENMIGTSTNNNSRNINPNNPNNPFRLKNPRSLLGSFNSYTTPEYKLHSLETPTNLYFVLTTSPHEILDLREVLKQVYQELFIPLVLRNPDYEQIGTQIVSEKLVDVVKAERASAALSQKDTDSNKDKKSSNKDSSFISNSQTRASPISKSSPTDVVAEIGSTPSSKKSTLVVDFARSLSASFSPQGEGPDIQKPERAAHNDKLSVEERQKLADDLERLDSVPHFERFRLELRRYFSKLMGA